jgi:hypothetical protein
MEPKNPSRCLACPESVVSGLHAHKPFILFHHYPPKYAYVFTVVQIFQIYNILCLSSFYDACYHIHLTHLDSLSLSLALSHAHAQIIKLLFKF